MLLIYLLIPLFVLAVAALAYLQSPSFKGKVGEADVNSVLHSFLNSREFRVLGDLTIPTSGGTTQIDHIVVSIYGVFSIETKNMSGWIFGNPEQTMWTQVVYRKKSRFQNPLRQNYHHMKVLQSLLQIQAHHIYNVIAFVGSAEPKTEMPPNVVWSTKELLNYIRSKKDIHFTEDEVQSLANLLEGSALEPNRKTRATHVQHVKAKTAKHNNDKTRCPRCSASMVQRTNRQSGQKFLACSRYPKCGGCRVAEPDSLGR